MMNNKPGLSFIVPAYNEADSVTETLNRLRETLQKTDKPFEIILVNDGSDDETLMKAKKFDDVMIINHPINIGYGNAIKSGIKAARYDWIGITDADGTYPIEDLPAFISEMEKGFDMVVGSRSNISDIDRTGKKLFRWIYKKIISLMIAKNIKDPNSGFRLLKRNMALTLYPFLCGTFSFTTSLTIIASGLHFFIQYIPITYSERNGVSKVRHFGDSIKTIQYIIQGITFFNPIKFFMYLAIFMILVVCIPAMFIALFNMHTLSLYYMIFGTAVTLLIALGVVGDIIRVSASQKYRELS
jgi:glycosyltransferase involved in cell wall biosynthesis